MAKILGKVLGDKANFDARAEQSEVDVLPKKQPLVDTRPVQPVAPPANNKLAAEPKPASAPSVEAKSAKKPDTETKPAVAKKPVVKAKPIKTPTVDNNQPQSSIELQKKPKKRSGIGRSLFILCVILPTILVSCYYAFVASDQYQSEMRFSVRGTNASPLDALGLNAIPGNTIQASDAYIVIEYLTSFQVLKDMKEKYGIDAREFYSKDSIDLVYNIDKDMPLEEFVYYWQWMIDASFNSTTGITTFRVNAFTGEDSATLTKTVLKVAEGLINDLSTEARSQLIKTAQDEVKRTEDRLSLARQSIRDFRDREQSLNPLLEAQSDQVLIQGLQKELIDLKARRAALTSTVNSDSPSVRIIDRQIRAINSELEKQKQNIGSGQAENGDTRRNLSKILSDYSLLELEEEFAQKSYTTALSSFEKSQAEARKEERYFAIVVQPTNPNIALYPLKIINTIIAFAIFFVGWLLIYLIVQAIRDHAV